MLNKRIILALLVAMLLIASLACRFSAPDPTATPVETGISFPETITQEPAETPAVDIVTEPPTEITQDSGGEILDLVRLDKSFWAQDGGNVFVAFFLENPNSHVIFEDIQNTIYLYGPTGEEIDKNYSDLKWIFPGQAIGIVSRFYLSDESIVISGVDVEWEYGSTTPATAYSDPFSMENVTFWENNDFPIVTGIINNHQTTTYTDVKADVICYNSAGEIVGGSSSYIRFIPGEGYMGFSTYVDAYAEVASVEVFITPSYSTQMYEGSAFWSDVSLLDSFFYEGDYGNILGGAILQNNTNSTLRNTVLYTTFYDASGTVTSAGYETIDILLPGASVGISPWIPNPPDEAESTEFDLLVLPGDADPGYELGENPFTVTAATVIGDYQDYVAVTFINNYQKQASEVDVYVILYNAAGKIIGGGKTWTSEPSPAGAISEVEVWVDYGDDEVISTIDVWVVPNFWTEFD